jgi:hypothetical protein
MPLARFYQVVACPWARVQVIGISALVIIAAFLYVLSMVTRRRMRSGAVLTARQAALT